MTYEYKYPRPGLTSDIAAFTIIDNDLRVALIKRGIEPFINSWALPGGYVRENEEPKFCAKREMSEETGFSIPYSYLNQFFTFGEPNRDPRGWVVSIAFYALVPFSEANKLTLKPGSDAVEAKWFSCNNLPNLAFDHAEIIKAASTQLRIDIFGADKIARAEEVFGFLPQKFTLAQLQNVFETIKGERLDKRNFRKWISESFDLKDTGLKEVGSRHRPAALFEYVGVSN